MESPLRELHQKELQGLKAHRIIINTPGTAILNRWLIQRYPLSEYHAEAPAATAMGDLWARPQRRFLCANVRSEQSRCDGRS